MSLKGVTVEEQLYNFLIDMGLSPNGACALMGNLQAESALKPNNLQNTFNSKFGLTDEQYTDGVDNGTYTNFVHDSAGYGLAQWTYYSRKEAMYVFHKGRNKSIGDAETQFQFLYCELGESYPSILTELMSNKSIRELSDLILTKYERPKNQSEDVQKLRASYGQAIYDRQVGGNHMTYSRQKVVDLVKSWEGLKEADGSFKQIIDIYNSFTGQFPRGTKMQYNWAWCAATWSALAIKLGYTAIMPIEISCFYLIEAAKKMNCWVEADNYVPSPGDAVLYDWQDSGIGDNTGAPDHVGTVIEVNSTAGYFVVMEGNYSDSVKKRTMSINGKFIRGFIVPKYTDNAVSNTPQESKKSIDVIAHEVIAGTWGTGDYRRKQLEAKGYDYNTVQSRVNEILNGGAAKASATATPAQPTNRKVTATEYAQSFDKSIAGTYKTTADLYLRNGAGTNKKALALIPKGYEAECYGYYSTFNGARWFYIQVAIDGVLYTGFSHSSYLKRR